MNLISEVEECCVHIESNKVTDRKKYCDRLSNLLEKEEVVTLLNGGNVSWKLVINSVQECLRKDADKIVDDLKKKGTSNTKFPSSELFIQVIKTAVKEAADEINVSKLVAYIIGCMRDSVMRRSYNTMFLIVLKDYILSSSCRGRIESQDWAELFTFLKKLYEDRVYEALVLRCFMLLVKWGPTSGLPPTLLREQFDFFAKICLGVSKNSPSYQQEDVLDISFDFCRHTAKDNRVSCCKFGEDVIASLAELYELNGREAKIKKQLVEFFLLQVTIHQPNGISEGHPCAFACNWPVWRKCVKVIYSLLSKEVNFYFKFNHKNSSFFITQGETVVLLEDFSKLFIDVSRQMFANPDLDVSMSLDATFGESSQKRQKIEVTLHAYINNIQITKSWLWIHIVQSIIRVYPALLHSEDYLNLLQILSTIQIESNEHNVVINVYSCLSVMLQIENKIDIHDCKAEVEQLWKVIGESTLRAFGLNQHKDTIEPVLRQLIHRKVVDLDIVLKTYTSGVLNITVQSIITLDSTMKQLRIIDDAQKRCLMNCVLNLQNLKDCNYLSQPVTAKFIVNLTLRQWPNIDDEDQIENDCDKYKDIKDIYSKSILEKNIYVPSKNNEVNLIDKTSTLDLQSFKAFANLMKNFIDSINSQSIEQLLNVINLLVNITNYLLEYKIFEETDVNSCLTMKLLERILNYSTLKKFQFYQNGGDREAKRLLECVMILDKAFMFSGNDALASRIKDVIPFDLLKTLVDILNDLQDDQDRRSELKFELKKVITKALSSFSCVSRTNLNQNQKNILEVLAAPNYNCSLDGDYKLLLTFLDSLKYSKAGILSDAVLGNVLKSIQEMCIVRYHYSENAVEILNIINVLYPHFAAGRDEDDKIASVALLKPFYEKREEYGPQVSLALLNCIGTLIKVDPEDTFSHWIDANIISYIPDFLCSNYQEIRFKAIEVLSIFFQEMTKSKRLTDFHRQEELFNKMYEKSLEVFEVSGEITQERRTDEIISRTSSVLHTFSTLILSTNCWIQECLYVLVKLKHIKNLGSVNKVLEIINNYLYNKSKVNCIEKYLDYILEKWLNEHYSIDNFPFALFDCQTKLEFYTKYFEICVPLLILTDRKDLVTVAKEKDINEKEIVEKTCSKILGQALCNDLENMDTILTTNKILIYYTHVVGLDGLKNCLIDNLDQLLLCMIRFVTDEKYILENFGQTVIFSQKNLFLQQFKVCLNFIEEFLCDGANIITFLLKRSISKFEKMLLVLKLDIYNTFTVDSKLKSFQRYAVWVDIILNSLNIDDTCHCFFIRDTIYTLINLIENHKEASDFINAVVRFIGLFLKKILPNFTDTFEQFLTFTVNSLKYFAVTLDMISDRCIEVLHFLIVDNACHLMTAIEKLDKFPQDSKFDGIRNVHVKIKYENREAALEEEICYFLQHEDFSTRQDSLIHLRNVLAKEKRQLKVLYDKLENIRGFSEDCERSSLHKLICMLAKMSCCANENMRFEAIKCLGELGPANLTTLVLQPEKEVLDIKCSPFELLTGHILSLLTEYIVHADINVVKTASETLYLILNSREGRKISESEVNFGYGKIDKKNFAPYFSQTKSSASSPMVFTNLFISNMNNDSLWCGDANISHEKWIVTLVTTLLETFTNKSYLPKLIPLCEVVPKLCEHLLPLLVNLLLYINDNNVNKILSQKINCFFSNHWTLTVPKYSTQNSITVNKKSVKCMLDVVSFVRLQKSYAAKSKSKQPGDLDLNYLKVAKAAEFCAAHFTAHLYSELWCQAKVQELERNKKNVDYLTGSTVLDFIFENEEECVGEALQNILRNAYKAIGDLDALPGCGVQFLLKPQFRVEHYKELGSWDQVTQFYETQVSYGIDSARKDLMGSLKKCGLYQLPLLCSKQSDDAQYECLWRLGRWNTVEKNFNLTDSSVTFGDFDKYRFYGLKALHDSNDYAFAEAKKLLGLCVIEHLRHTSLESSQNVYPILAQLQALNEVEDFADAIKSKKFVPLINKWKLQDDLIKNNDFQYFEPIVTQRTVMLSDYLKIHQDDSLKNFLVQMVLDFADLAKQEGQFHVASASLSRLQFMSDLTDDIKTQIQLMDAQISWSVNDKLVAHHILNKLCKNESINTKLQSVALKLSGQYKSETFSENRMTIIADYFLKSFSIMSDVEKNQDDYNSILDTYDKLAQYADKGYQQIMTYMKSDLFQKKVVNMEKSKETASKIQRQTKKTRDEFLAHNIHVKQSNIDQVEIETAKQERNQFFKIALRYYILNLSHTDKNNIRIFRVMALLFENKNNPIITATHKEMLPSYKYITMLPQLIPHITEMNTDLYNKIVNEIVEKCAIQHPHHTLPLLLSLANAHKDREFSDPKTKTSSNDARVATATNLIKKLKTREALNSHIHKLQQLCQALIELAYYMDPDIGTNKKVFNIPRNQKILKIKDFDDILLPTHTLPVSKTCNYANIVGISSFGAVYHPVGGVNHPKRLKCRGTDGDVRSQLLKGQDDLRQDAVMQQVFTIMNNLLSTNKQTKNLLIRTYKIVPLSMRSGILEWVDNSMPIGDYLVGKDKEIVGAHQIYRPMDKLPSSCKQTIKNAASKTSEQRLAAFKSICQIFKPVFHKFFETSFPHPTIWYERRRAYIHSVATSSMCGYILGIGDRHVNNILIDKTTAEVIHIDFGIAFEQGRVLPTPETVPFRLTRDIVDGMGVSGVEGIFRRSCEKTMEVLRQNSQTIITILEVLLYDPLYVWTVTSAEANKRQTDDDNDLRSLSPDTDEENASVNITAERALLRLREKLQGTELGHPTSIEHQVGTLIQQAMDPANLCKLYYGWQAYV